MQIEPYMKNKKAKAHHLAPFGGRWLRNSELFISSKFTSRAAYLVMCTALGLEPDAWCSGLADKRLRLLLRLSGDEIAYNICIHIPLGSHLALYEEPGITRRPPQNH